MKKIILTLLLSVFYLIPTYSQVAVISGGVMHGPVLNVSNCENLNYTTFANATPTGFDAISNGGDTHRCGTADEISITNAKVYEVTFDLVLNSGSLPEVLFAASLGGAVRSVGGAQGTSEGANYFELEATETDTAVLQFLNFSAVTDYEITNLSIREIL